MKKIAIIGAGFAGVATAYFLSLKKTQVTLFDPHGIAGGASGIATGLLHKYGGRTAKKNRFADEGQAATEKLIKAIKQPIAEQSGLLRIPLTTKQEEDFRSVESADKNLSWKKGLWIPDAWTIDCKAYLNELWNLSGADLVRSAISSLDELSSFDAVVIAAGPDSKIGCKNLPLHPVKGQLLKIDHPPLPHPICSRVYIVPQQGFCIAGATFEHHFDSTVPDQAVAEKQLLPEMAKLLPGVSKEQVMGCKAALRATTPGRLPLSQQIEKNIWVLAGFGAKGLLYHALYAEKLVESMGI